MLMRLCIAVLAATVSCLSLTSQTDNVQQKSGGACFLCQSVSVGLSQWVGVAFDLLQTSV